MRYKVLLLVCFVSLCGGYLHPQPALLISQAPGSTAVRFEAGQAGRHRLELDDAPNFETPVFSKTFETSYLEVDSHAAGLIPGITYNVRLDGITSGVKLQLRHAPLNISGASCATLRHTWEAEGRFTTGTAFSGLTWANDHWVIKPHTFLLGESLYNAELILRPALAAARACNDLKTFDEIAQYYVIMLQQTESVGDLLQRPQVTAETRSRLESTNKDARTFNASFGDQVGEGELYNSQWLHPAALLIRLITLLPEESQTPAMKMCVVQYTEFIVKDQLERYLFQQKMPPLGGVSATGRVAHWEQAMSGKKGRVPWDSAVSDIDLWWLSSTAELLGANANNRALVKISQADLADLRRAMDTGIRFLQSERTLHPETKDLSGRLVGSATYFEGDDALDEDMLYSAVTTERFPTPAERRGFPKISWDSSHVYRLAIFLRALYENKKALHSAFPQFEDLRLVVNQYVYKVFNGDFARPVFRNNFDGSDGWFRVNYSGAGVGHPPSAYCNMQDPARRCLTPGAILAWGQLAFVNEDLARVERSLIQLGFTSDPAAKAFRDRHYFYTSPFKLNLVDGFDVYGGALYFVIAENADMIQ